MKVKKNKRGIFLDFQYFSYKLAIPWWRNGLVLFHLVYAFRILFDFAIYSSSRVGS